MTDNELQIAIQLRGEGKNYGEIAKELGTTRQRVRYWITQGVSKTRVVRPLLERIPSRESLEAFKDTMNELGVYTGRTQRYVDMALLLHKTKNVRDVADEYGLTKQAVYSVLKNGI